MPEVKKEITRWRDLDFNDRHRLYGFDCPALDLDFLEYDNKKAVALIEYKNENAPEINPVELSANLLALIDLGNKANIPVFFCRYWKDYSKFRIVPLNNIAKTILSAKQELTEYGFVKFLYEMRNREIPDGLFDDMGKLIVK